MIGKGGRRTALRKQQDSRNRRRGPIFLILVFLQMILVGGFFVFIILSEDVVNPKQQSFSGELKFNCFSSVKLSANGKKEFESKKKMYLIPIYQKAAAKYKIPWEYLAGINYVETRLWTVQRESVVGAVGPMQFMDRTWVGWTPKFAEVYPIAKNTPHWGSGDINNALEKEIQKPEVIKRFGGYGTDGDGDGLADPKNEVDAIFSAAKYLAHNGMADGNIDRAILAYNHSQVYLKMVKDYAQQFTEPVTGGNRAQIPTCQEDRGTESFYLGTVGNDWGWPLPQSKGVIISSPYSYGTCDGNGRCNHGGIDFASPTINGDYVVATQDGIAYGRVQVGINGLTGCGYYTLIKHGNGVETYYCHLIEPSPIPKTGKRVKKGDVVGRVGSTGNSTGPHLHYQVKVNGRITNPLPYLYMSGMK